jgi:hypothetical protein
VSGENNPLYVGRELSDVIAKALRAGKGEPVRPLWLKPVGEIWSLFPMLKTEQYLRSHKDIQCLQGWLKHLNNA